MRRLIQAVLVSGTVLLAARSFAEETVKPVQDASAQSVDKKPRLIADRTIKQELERYKIDDLKLTLFKPETIRALHANNVTDFISVQDRFGMSRMPRAFGPSYGVVTDAAEKEQRVRFQLSSRELIGLIVNPQPVAYFAPNVTGVSMRLPEDYLKDLKTRELDGFEKSALEQLRGGRDIVVSEAADSLRIVGAIRATSDCASCHACKENELLGAFAYRLAPAGNKHLNANGLAVPVVEPEKDKHLAAENSGASPDGSENRFGKVFNAHRSTEKIEPK